MGYVPLPRAPSYRPKTAADAALEGIAMGNKIVDRLAFWSAFGLLAWPIQNRLCDRLDAISFTLEKFVDWRDLQAKATTLGATETFPVTVTTDSTGFLPNFSGQPFVPYGGSGVQLANSPVPEPVPVKKVWGKSGTWTEDEIVQQLQPAQILEHHSMTGSSRYWCKRCNSYFDDGVVAANHGCQRPPAPPSRDD